MDVVQIMLTPHDIRAACAQHDIVFGYDGTRWGWMTATESNLWKNVRPHLFTEVERFSERFSITIAVVTIAGMEQVWNDRRVHVVLIEHDNAIIKEFMEATPWGRREANSRRVVSYNESWDTWTVSLAGRGDLLQMWGYDD